jgi:hypothetical protein
MARPVSQQNLLRTLLTHREGSPGDAPRLGRDPRLGHMNPASLDVMEDQHTDNMDGTASPVRLLR